MKIDYDVIIIGAGPSGTSCAKLLKNNFLNVLILEKKKLPRYKPCGGLISKRALDNINEIFGKIPEKVICNNSPVTTLISKTGDKFFPLPFEYPEHIKVSRIDFDYWLQTENGLDVQDESMYINHEEKNNIICVNYLYKNEIKELTCKYLVGADGAGSKVRKSIDKDYNSLKFAISKQIIIKGNSTLDSSKYYFFKNKEYTDFFSWFNIENDLIYIGTLYKIENKNKKYLEQLIQLLNKNFNLNVNEKIRQEFCLIDLRYDESRFYFGKNNILIIGDASGLVYRLGEGIPSALISAKQCAKSIINSINSGSDIFKLFNENIKEEKNYCQKNSF